MHCSEYIVTAADGTDLFVRKYAPQTGDACRVLVIVHGASEHGGRYEHVARALVDCGWNVVSADLRGHGRSGGPRTHVTHFHRYIADLEFILNDLNLPAERTALLGHSMGGLISIRFAQRFPQRAASLILTSPLLGLGVNVKIPRTVLALGKLMSIIAPRWRFRSRVKTEDTTRSPDVLARRAEDPLIHPSLTAGWFFEMQRARQSAWTDAHKLTLPLLALQAGQDRVVDPDVVGPWVQTTGSLDKTFHHLPDHLHEVLNEPDWKATVACIAEWLEQRIVRFADARTKSAV
jgi:lysophospholipase